LRVSKNQEFYTDFKNANPAGFCSAGYQTPLAN